MAPVYRSETDVFQGVQKNDILQKDVFLTTMIALNIMRDGMVREPIDKSPRYPGGESIDLALIHCPVKDYVEETWKILEGYGEKEKVRAIGMCHFNPYLGTIY